METEQQVSSRYAMQVLRCLAQVIIVRIILYCTMFVVARVYHVFAHDDDAVAVDGVEKRQRSVSVISFKFALSWDCFFGWSTARSWICGKFCQLAHATVCAFQSMDIV